MASFFHTSMPYELDESEPDIIVFYTSYPAEKATRFYPGCEASVEIDEIEIVGRELTAAEEKALFSEHKDWLEELAFENERKIRESAMDFYEYLKCKAGKERRHEIPVWEFKETPAEAEAAFA